MTGDKATDVTGQIQFDQNRAVSFSAGTIEETESRSASRGVPGIGDASVHPTHFCLSIILNLKFYEP